MLILEVAAGILLAICALAFFRSFAVLLLLIGLGLFLYMDPIAFVVVGVLGVFIFVLQQEAERHKIARKRAAREESLASHHAEVSETAERA